MRIRWAEHGHRLGTCYDSVLARELGVSTGAVGDARRRRGYMAWAHYRHWHRVDCTACGVPHWVHDETKQVRTTDPRFRRR